MDNVWAGWLRAAVARGVRVEDFWGLSWCEWRMLMGPPVDAVLRREGLAALMQRFPDGGADGA